MCRRVSNRPVVEGAQQSSAPRPSARPRRLGVASAIAALVLVSMPAAAQQDLPDAHDPAALETYLESLGLRDLLVMHLRDRLREANPEDRSTLAERLAALYAQQLDESESPDDAARVESAARELLALVPESESNELRITLAKARYLSAERIGEHHLLRLAAPEEAAEAERAMRSVGASLREVLARVDRRITELERAERSPRSSTDEAEVRELLAEARRQRSLARYYSGWTNLHLSILTGSPRHAQDALADFAWLVNSPGERRPVPERAPTSLLRYDHVARAVLGCALASSLADEHADAVRWIQVLDDETAEVAERVAPQVFPRRVLVLGRARRWADLESAVDHERRARVKGGAAQLEPLEARLLAVVTLEALADPSARGLVERDRLLEALAQVGLGDLVSAGELGHVLDLVSRYGTAPIGEEGFVVRYVRAVRAYERAKTEHAATGEPPDEPTAVAEVANRYREAALAFDAASEADDAARFADQASRSQQLRGLALFHAGDFVGASAAFESAAGSARDPRERDDALWYALLALDRAVDAGIESERARRERLATVYMQEFPGGERAARLLLREAGAGLVSDAEAVEILLAVPVDSPVYAAARRRAASLLYRAFRAAPAPAREAAADRFARVGAEVLEAEVAEARGEGDPAVEAARRVVTLGRQLLDAILASAAPDAASAGRVLAVVEDAVTLSGADAAALAGELAFRRLQIGIALDDDAAIDAAMSALGAGGGQFVEAGERLLYRRALAQRNRDPADPRAADRLLAAGMRVLDQFEPLEQHAADATMRGVLSRSAAAAADIWRHTGDDVHRQTALTLDRRAVAMRAADDAALRRLGELAESMGELDEALEAWRVLGAALQPGSTSWFEARYHTIRLLAESDPARAREALAQLRVLYPSGGPEPWSAKLEELALRIGPAAPADGGAR